MIADYRHRARVLNPKGNGYSQSGGICFLGIKKPGKMNIFSHSAAALPQVVFEMWKRKDITPESILNIAGEHYLISEVTDRLDGKLLVYAVQIPVCSCTAEGAYIGKIEDITGFVCEKYMKAPEDEFHTEEQETNILLTNKAVVLSLGDLVTIADDVWTVKKRYTFGQYRNEYEITRYGNGR